MTVAVHDFRKSLEKSAAYVDADWWPIVYRRAFPTLSAYSSVRQDGWAQRAGIDRILTLACGRVIRIDEKIRDKDYGDILLEYWSDRDRQIHGWILKPLACDFIAYAVAPTKICYLFDTVLLQRAWKQNAAQWDAAMKGGDRRFKKCEAVNKGYVTVSLAVPLDVLLTAIQSASIISWEDA